MSVTIAVLPFISGAPVEINRVSLPSGPKYLLASDFILTDAVYSLWRKRSENIFFWQRVTEEQISYSEDFSFISDPELVLTPDQSMLLIRRGGIWTDCLLVGKILKQCEGTSSTLGWQDKDKWIEQSKLISKISGLDVTIKN